MEQLSIVWLQIANFLLAFCLGAGLSGTCHVGMTGDDALAISVFYGFGIGYSIRAIRHEQILEKILGWVGICVFCRLVTLTIIKIVLKGT